MTIDLSIQKNWEAICNYDQFSEIRDDDKIYTNNPEKWLKVIKNIDTSIFSLLMRCVVFQAIPFQI